MGRHLSHQRIGILLVVSSLSMAGCGSYFSEAELASRQAVAAPAQPGPAAIDTSGVPSFTPAAARCRCGRPLPRRHRFRPGRRPLRPRNPGPPSPRLHLPRLRVAAPAAPAAAAVPAAVRSGPRSPIVLCSFGNSSGVLGAVSGPAPIGNAAWAVLGQRAHGGLAGAPGQDDQC